MKSKSAIVPAMVVLVLAGLGWPVNAHAKPDPVKAVHIIGIPGLKDNAKGTLRVENGQLQFVHGNDHFAVSAVAITDVMTGEDTKASVGKTLSVMSMAAPYGSGRALGLFRTKIDTLTIQYRGRDGEMHGAIFTVAAGAAEGIKQELLARGAHTTASDRSATTSNAPGNSSNEEKQR